jgi:peptidase M49-like protein
MKIYVKILFFALAICLSFNFLALAKPQPASNGPELSSDIAETLSKFPRTVIDYDHSLLNQEDQKVLAVLIEASRFIDNIFWKQVSEENPALRKQLVAAAASSEKQKQALELFDLMKGRWNRLEEDKPFIGPFGEKGKKPLGAGAYPVDMTKEEFEKWIAAHPEDKEKFQGLFTVIRRQNEKLVAIPYSQYYRSDLESAAAKLREAAQLTSNASLKNFLTKRADAFLTDDYYASDVAWIDVNSPIEMVIGPYEVYEDALFNYKASYECFVTVVDKPESDKLAVYLKHLPDMERGLPIPDEHKNPNRGSSTALRIVQEVFTSGEARSGVQTAAFNLPNDEKVREGKGFKNVLLKNVMQAKFSQSGEPIAKRVLDPSQVSKLSFDAYFNHTLFHELSHGVGPGMIKGPDGKRVDTRILLKNLYSTIEECKADVLGIWNLLYAIDQKLITSFDPETLYITDAGLMFRSMRFGISEAHGRGTAVQWNWYREKGAIVASGKNQFKVDLAKTHEAVKSLANELLMIEATGDYQRAERLLEKYGVTNEEINRVTESLKGIPVDIAPVFPAAGEK